MTELTPADREAAIKQLTGMGLPAHVADQVAASTERVVMVDDEKREVAAIVAFIESMQAVGARIVTRDGRDITAQMRDVTVAGMGR